MDIPISENSHQNPLINSESEKKNSNLKCYIECVVQY